MLEIQKIRKDINWLLEQIKCLMKKSDLDSPLVATEWSSNHSIGAGNPYILNSFVWYNGHVYKSLVNNNTNPPTNATYWEDLGEAHLLLEEQSDWNATTGRAFIKNKPTHTSDFINDGQDGSSSYATLNDLSAAIPLPQGLNEVLGVGDNAPNKSANIGELGLYDDFDAPTQTPGYAKIYADKFRFWFKDKAGVIMASLRSNGLGFNIGAYGFNITLPNITANRTASFQDKSGVVAYISDIPTVDLVATVWSANHTTGLGNPYLIGTRVYYNGNVYQAIANNDGIIPTNSTYWLNLGTGKLLDQELPPTQVNADWNATSGPEEILNKPSLSGFGDMFKSTYDVDNTGIVDNAEAIKIIGRNSTGATLYRGTVVYLNGATGNRPNFAKAQANAESTSAGTFGIIVDDLANNSDGYCIALGYLDNLDTRTSATHPFTSDTLADGDTIYLSPTTAGYITNVKPSAPNHLVYLGKVTRTSPTNGTIVYRIQNGYELEELHNVAISSLLNNQFLVYESSTGLWKNKPLKTINGISIIGSGDIIISGGGSTAVKLTSQTLTAASWTLSGGYYTYSFSNVNIDATCDVSVTPQNASYQTAYNAQILPYIGVATGVATFYSQFPPAADMVVDIVITQTA